LKEAKIDPKTVLLFDAAPGWNKAGGPADMDFRHFGKYCQIMLADGESLTVRQNELDKLRWEP
jgi:hypothetical protein